MRRWRVGKLAKKRRGTISQKGGRKGFIGRVFLASTYISIVCVWARAHAQSTHTHTCMYVCMRRERE